MVITYYGHEYLKIQFGDTIIAINPISKNSTLKTSRFGADIALIGLNDENHNGTEQLISTGKNLFIIRGPGEYEIKDIVIRGFQTQTSSNGKIRTFYLVLLEGMTLCFLTGLEQKELPKEMLEELSEVDILFIPVFSDNVLSPAEIYKIALSLSPHMIVPMSLDQGDMNATLKTFVEEGGMEQVKPIEKLTIKKKDLVDKEGEIVLLLNN